MGKYVKRVIAMREGKRVRHLKNYKKGAVKYADAVELMDETGSADVTERYTFSVDVVIPVIGSQIDLSSVIDETWVFQYRVGGAKTTYTGVRCLNEGEATTDGEGETVITYEFMAETRTIES